MSESATPWTDFKCFFRSYNAVVSVISVSVKIRTSRFDKCNGPDWAMRSFPVGENQFLKRLRFHGKAEEMVFPVHSSCSLFIPARGDTVW